MMTNADLEALQSFNDVANRLVTSTFASRAATDGLRMTITFDPAIKVDIGGLSEEETDAFVLALRMFIQDNEAISIRNIGRIYETLPASDSSRDAIEKIREWLNRSLDQEAFLGKEGGRVTIRERFETVVYGNKAHLNRAKREEYERLRAHHELTHALLMNEFHRGCLLILEAVRAIARVNQNVLTANGE